MIQLYAAEGTDNVAQNCTLFIRQNHNIALTEEVEMLKYFDWSKYIYMYTLLKQGGTSVVTFTTK